MDYKKELVILLRKFFDDGDDDRLGWLSQVQLFNMLEIMREYLSPDMINGNDLCRIYNILLNVWKHIHWVRYKASTTLIDSFQEVLSNFLTQLTEKD